MGAFISSSGILSIASGHLPTNICYIIYENKSIDHLPAGSIGSNLSVPKNNDHAEDCETTTVRFCRFDFNKEASSEIVKAILKNQFNKYSTFTEKGHGDTYLLLDFNKKLG